METERKKLDLMQSMGNGREDWDTTYHFLTSLWEPINRLPEDRHEHLRDDISGDPKQKETQSSTCSSRIQLFHYDHGRSIMVHTTWNSASYHSVVSSRFVHCTQRY